MLKKMVIAGFIVWCFIAGTFTSPCLAYEPQRIAILPVVNSAPTYYRDAEQVIHDAMQAKFKRPLASVVTIYELIPPAEVQSVLPAGFQRPKKMMKLETLNLPELAERLKADVVIGAEITDFSSMMITNFRDDILQKTDIAIRIVGYDVQTKKQFEFRDFEHYDDAWSTLGDPDYLAKQIMNRLLDKVIL